MSRLEQSSSVPPEYELHCGWRTVGGGLGARLGGRVGGVGAAVGDGDGAAVGAVGTAVGAADGAVGEPVGDPVGTVGTHMPQESWHAVRTFATDRHRCPRLPQLGLASAHSCPAALCGTVARAASASTAIASRTLPGA